MGKYDHKRIEKKWQERWAKEKIYETKESKGKQKAYVLDMFPYPSGEGLHVGHPKGYIATDVYARMKRMQGRNVLHPMGWDAFGLPAENYAIKNKVHPRVAVGKNIANFKKQLSHIGFDYDWSREINTTDPSYYKWTQWIFLKLFERGLAYQSHEPINWCPSCQTGLANEDLEKDGTCERCGSVVEKRPMRQWVLKITDYTDRLLDDLEKLPDWPEHIKEQQRNWIGRSEGAELTFPIVGHPMSNITVFTTRPDTLFGATYMVLAPEHPLVEQCKDKIENLDEVYRYIDTTKKKTEVERTAEGKEKTGIELKGVKAINPGNKEEIPVFIADYVLAHYGTGAIMAVPAHDERDFVFAKQFDLPIKQVIALECGVPNDAADERQGGVAVIYNPRTKKLAVARHSSGELRLYGGGVPLEEDIQKGILREVAEESGFHNFSLRESLFTCYTNYYNVTKNIHRKGRGTCLLLVLENEQQKELRLEDHEVFELQWVESDELRAHWESRNGNKDYDHWILFLELAVGRLRELGYEITGDHTSAPLFSGNGVLIDSGEFSGLRSEEAKQKITEAVGGEMKSTYKIRDWVFSRQRYWGEPIPVIHCEKCGAVPVPEEDLPVLLPEVEQYEPTGTGESPLAAISEWVNVDCPKCGGAGKRETNTMPQWAGSSWYWLRFMDPDNDDVPVSAKKEKMWGPVDVYVGGDHAVRHLIYARFWHKFLYDIDAVSTEEPFTRLEFLGFILAEDGRKMSKRWGNIINPDDVVERFGADTFRTYEMFMGPFENTIAWSTDNLIGVRRFIERVWRMAEKVQDEDIPELEPVLHQTIKKVSSDIESFKFNTAVSQMMIFLNEVEKHSAIGKEQFKLFLKALAPFAPHVADELWEVIGSSGSIHVEPWPVYDEHKAAAKTVTIAVQVNGKVRGSVGVAVGATEDEVTTQAKLVENVSKWLDGKEVQKVIFVPDRLINFVLG